MQTGITVVRMMNVVERTGRSDVLGPQSDAYGPGIQRKRLT